MCKTPAICLFFVCVWTMCHSHGAVNPHHDELTTEIVEFAVYKHVKHQHNGDQYDFVARLFETQNLLRHLVQNQDIPGPEWRFVPEFLGSAFPEGEDLHWKAPCFASDSLGVTINPGNTVRVVLKTAERKDGLGCSDAYLFATISEYHVLEPRLGGSHVIEWEGLETVRKSRSFLNIEFDLIFWCIRAHWRISSLMEYAHFASIPLWQGDLLSTSASVQSPPPVQFHPSS